MKHIAGLALAAALSMGNGIGASIAYGRAASSGFGGHRVKREKRQTARERIPKAFRQYAKRYGKHSPKSIEQMHARFPQPHIDHARDQAPQRIARARRKLSAAMTALSAGIEAANARMGEAEGWAIR